MPGETITETIIYPIVIHHDGDTFGYFSPEFGGGGAPTFSDAVRVGTGNDERRRG